ncbi:MAG: PAS domain-containing sensor histidine kinase [Vicinamibacterales bacterium]
MIIERSTQLNVFLQSFADVVRLPPPRPEKCDLAELARAVGRLVQPLGAARQVEWKWDVASGVPLVWVDRSQLEQALLNVFKNAVEAVPEKGVVRVSTGQDEGTPWLAVEDNGPGIADAVREHLFTPFFSTKPRGQGIGLTLVQEILRQHDLPFALESAPGGPTRFVVRFPTTSSRTP